MKQVLFMAVLAAGMLLAGCAKEESDDMEGKQTLTKEQIVGVWRNGDYWVSFSESGYASTFLKLKDLEIINDGDFRLSGDTIITKSSPWWHETPYIVNHVTNSEISMTVTFAYPTQPSSRRTDTVILQKSMDVPCDRNDGLARKFIYLNGRKCRFDDNEYKTIDRQLAYVFYKPFLYFGRFIGELSDFDKDTVTCKPVIRNN